MKFDTISSATATTTKPMLTAAAVDGTPKPKSVQAQTALQQRPGLVRGGALDLQAYDRTEAATAQFLFHGHEQVVRLVFLFLGQEHLDEARVLRQVRVDALEREHLLEVRRATQRREVNRGHAAAGHLQQQLVASEALVLGGRKRGHDRLGLSAHLHRPGPDDAAGIRPDAPHRHHQPPPATTKHAAAIRKEYGTGPNTPAEDSRR